MPYIRGYDRVRRHADLIRVDWDRAPLPLVREAYVQLQRQCYTLPEGAVIRHPSPPDPAPCPG